MGSLDRMFGSVEPGVIGHLENLKNIFSLRIQCIVYISFEYRGRKKKEILRLPNIALGARDFTVKVPRTQDKHILISIHTEFLVIILRLLGR